MMKQYDDAKAACGDALLLFRMGDFYELFQTDAKVAAEKLGLTLTARDKGEDAIPMAGFPHHQLDSYLAKLIKLGMRVAVCEQVEDAKKAKGLVRREITRIVSPGTITDQSLLDPRHNNFLAAITTRQSSDTVTAAGLAWLEISTGEFWTAEIGSANALRDLLARIRPSEILLDDDTVLKLKQQNSPLQTILPEVLAGPPAQ